MNKIPSPDGVNTVVKRHKIDISKSIMIGSLDFERGLSQLCGFKHHFHRESFFLANEFALDMIGESTTPPLKMTGFITSKS